jgi:putative FmdB family regulatory protein
MPLFEYICEDCQKQFTFMSGVVADNSDPQCPRCQSAKLRKLISRVSRGRSDDDRMDDFAEKMDNQNMDDPNTLRRFAREMGNELSAESGEDMRDEIEQLIEDEAREEKISGDKSSSGDDGTIY